MKTRSLQTKVLDQLTDGRFHSGEILGSLFGVSRAAIWKAIKLLQQSGLSINNIRGRGYQLLDQVELLDLEKIHHQLDGVDIPVIHIFDSINSTNQFLMQSQNTKSGTICIAEQQSAGRGRLNRQWISPFASNLYLSCFWQFQSGAAECIGLSLVVGLALIKALEECGYSELGLKWPNDLYYQGRKLAGILVEMSGDLHGPCNTVIGIGLNVNMPPQAGESITQPWIDLKTIANNNESRNKIAAYIIQHLQRSLPEFEQKGLSHFTQDWSQHDILNGQTVNLHLRDEIIEGVAKGINAQGCLLVESDNKIKAYHSGEVSIRLKNAE